MQSTRFHSSFVPVVASLLLAVLTALSGCASSSSAVRSSDPADDPPIRVTLFTQGQQFELVNPGHTDPVEYYSEVRSDADRKIVSTEVMEELVDFVGESGFEDYGAAGSLPRFGWSTAVELEGSGGLGHWSVGKSSSASERQAMFDLVQNFLALYNQVTSFQRIENEQGSRYFDKSSTR